MPKYPHAVAASSEQIKINQTQFKWFAKECERRNIQILLHFYNIHVITFLNTFNSAFHGVKFGVLDVEDFFKGVNLFPYRT